MAFSISSLFGSKDKRFFDLFEGATQNLIDISDLLYIMLQEGDLDKRKNYIRQIDELENRGDEFTHRIFNELHKTFITPFDREDIHALASSIDNIVDYIHGTAKRISIYKIIEISDEMIKLAELVKSSSHEVHLAVTNMRYNNKIKEVNESCVKINSIENHADDIFDNAIGRLFEEEKDAIKLIKYKEILAAMETATDMCEDASDTIRAIMIKYS